MAEINQYQFSHDEVAEALVKHQGIHEGLWGITVEFGFNATNISLDPTGTTIMPAGICLLQKIGLTRFDKPNNLTVDAAKVNPLVTDKGSSKKKSG